MAATVVSPLTTIREQENRTLRQIADEANINLQAVYLCEQGVYSEILPSLLALYTHKYDRDGQLLRNGYRRFVQHKRRHFGQQHELIQLTPSDLGPPVGSPLREFRRELSLSRMAFCKDICVHPAQELRTEMGKTMGGLPEQIKEAFREAGASYLFVQEMDSRVREYSEMCMIG